jgi:hypothetical protein
VALAKAVKLAMMSGWLLSSASVGGLDEAALAARLAAELVLDEVLRISREPEVDAGAEAELGTFSVDAALLVCRDNAALVNGAPGPALLAGDTTGEAAAGGTG